MVVIFLPSRSDFPLPSPDPALVSAPFFDFLRDSPSCGTFAFGDFFDPLFF